MKKYLTTERESDMIEKFRKRVDRIEKGTLKIEQQKNETNQETLKFQKWKKRNSGFESIKGKQVSRLKEFTGKRY